MSSQALSQGTQAFERLLFLEASKSTELDDKQTAIFVSLSMPKGLLWSTYFWKNRVCCSQLACMP